MDLQNRYFCKVAAKNGLLTERDARRVLKAVEKARRAGNPVKARDVAIKSGLIETRLAHRIHKKVKVAIREKVRPEARQIRGYELRDCLGDGAMGSVYRARQVNLNKTVALKLLHPQFSRDKTYLCRFLQEARATASLNHPNIVQAYDVGESNGYYYIAMEYVPGRNARDILRQQPFEERRALEIVRDLAAALKHAHEAGIIHRDIKPANVLIGEDGEVKLADLGLAKAPEVDSNLTQAGKALGTPYYMAPEQALESGAADERCDIYSLGATLYHMVTGTVPYDGDSPYAVVSKALKGNLPNPRQHAPDLSEDTVRLIKKMMARKPERRISDATLLLEAVEGILAGKSFSSGAVVVPKKMRARRRRRPNRPGSGGYPARTNQGWKRFGFVFGAGVAACLLVAALIGFSRASQSRSDVLPASIAQAGEDEEQPVDEKPDANTRANRALAKALKETDGRSVERRIQRLQRVVLNHRGTPAARQALGKIEELEGSRTETARKLLEEADIKAQPLRDANRLADAVAVYEALLEREDVHEVRSDVKRRIVDLEAKITLQLAEAERDAAALAKAGKFEEAAALLKRAMENLPTTNRAQMSSRITEYLSRAEKVEARQAQERRKEEKRLVDSCIDDVRAFLAAHATREAADRIESVRERIQDDELRQELDLAARSVTYIGEFFAVASRALARLEGKKRTFHLTRGRTVTGRIVDASGPRLTIALGYGEMEIGRAEIPNRELYRLTEELYGNKNPYLQVGYGALAFWSGDEAEARRALTLARKSETEAIRDVAAELVAHLPEPVVAEGKNDAPAPEKEEAKPEAETDVAASSPETTEAERKQYALEKYVYEHIDDLFEGQVLSYDGSTHEVKVRYDFVHGFKELPSDWSLLYGDDFRYDGKAQGLKFEGNRKKRILLDAVFADKVAIEADLRLDMSLISRSRITPVVVAPKAKTEIQSPFGLEVLALHRGRLEGRSAGPKKGATRIFKANNPYNLRLEMAEGVVRTQLDNQDRSGLRVPVDGGLRVGFDFAAANGTIHYVTVTGKLDLEWAKAALKNRLEAKENAIR